MVAGASTMIGRAAEYEVLRMAADRALAGLPQVVLLTGEAGVGKSRLVAELVQRFGPRDWVVLVGSSSAAASRTLALAPWIEAMSALGIEPTPASSPFATTGEQHGAMARALLELARVTPTLLVLEDVHWA